MLCYMIEILALSCFSRSRDRNNFLYCLYGIEAIDLSRCEIASLISLQDDWL